MVRPLENTVKAGTQLNPSDAHSRSLGCLLGGAVGDALGAPVEFMGYDEIVENFGPCGIMEYAPYGGRNAGAITDDTQMTLFTAEGLLLGHSQIADGESNIPAALSRAYLRWLKTQGVQPAIQNPTVEGWLFGIKELHHIRAPGKTCIKELKALQSPTGEKADNDKKGCGGVMRVAPVGIFGHGWLNEPDGEKRIFELGCQAAWITHGHPTGYLAAGAFSLMIAHLMMGTSLPGAISCTAKVLECYDGHEETTAAIQNALLLAHERPGKPACVRVHLPIEQIWRDSAPKEAKSLQGESECSYRAGNAWFVRPIRPETPWRGQQA